MLRPSIDDVEDGEVSALTVRDPGVGRAESGMALGFDQVAKIAVKKGWKPPTTPPAPTPAAPPQNVAAANTTGKGVVIGIVDTGVDYNHPQIKGRYSSKSTCFGACPTAYTRAGGDDNSHGTHVAGIAAGNTVGVAKGATIMSVKALDKSGSGSYSDIANAIRYAATNGAHVINMSLGGSSPWSGLQSALQFAAPKSVIVAAAGNSGNNKTPSYPAAYAATTGVRGSMIIVGAVDGNNRIASFSQTPGNVCTKSGSQSFCLKDYFVVAPGVSIYSSVPNGGYARYSGTSMATPHVAGVAALVKGQSPHLSSTQVVDIILRSATDLGTKGTDAVYGRGRVNVNAAMAPVGVTSIPTGGGMTLAYSGTTETRGSRSSGVMAPGLNQSVLLKQTVLLDEYGRDYTIDLGAAASSKGMSLEGIIGDNTVQVTPLAIATEGLLFTALVAEDTQLGIASWDMSSEDEGERAVTDVFLRASLTEDVEASFGSSLSLAGRLNDFDAAASPAFDGLFLESDALNSPFALVANGGEFMGMGARLSDTLSMRVAYANYDEEKTETDPTVFDLPSSEEYAPTANETLRSAETIAISAALKVTPWLGIGVTAMHIEESNGLLGSDDEGALAMASASSTNSAGAAVRLGLGDGWFAAASASAGSTEATPAAGGLVTSFSTLTSASYGVAVSKQGVFDEDDTIGFALTRPLHIIDGTGHVTAATDVTDDTRDIVYGSENLSFASDTPQTDFEAGYTNWMADGMMSLQFNAAYQMDVNGEAGESAVAAMTRLKLKM